MPKCRKSYGIALCRINAQHEPEIILVKKRYTYQFFEFVLGKYQKSDARYLTKLFNCMTYQEKMDILSLKFDTLWYKIWLEVPGTDGVLTCKREVGFNEKRYLYSYSKSKRKFESFLNDKNYLRKLINHSSNSETVWEIPRGRKISNEKEVDAAIREFNEETGVDPRKYTILWNVKPIVTSYKDAGVVYKTTYYLAQLDPKHANFEPKVYFSSYNQIIEVEAIKWCSSHDVQALVLNQVAKKRSVKLIRAIMRIWIRSRSSTPEGCHDGNIEATLRTTSKS